MAINLTVPRDEFELKPKITVVGTGGAGGNAVNNMIRSNLEGVDFIVANTDAQALNQSLCDVRLQLGTNITRGLGAGSRPEIGRAAAEEALEQILEYLQGSNMVFVTAGMGGGTGTGAAPVIARAAKEQGILTVGVVTKPFHFEGAHRMRMAEQGLADLQQVVDTLIVIPNQNLFRIANEKTTFADAFKLADQVLHSGVSGITDLMVKPGLVNLDFADIRAVMMEMGKAMMGTGEGEGDNRAIQAAEAAISNPLLDDVSMRGARGVLINVTGGYDMTLFELDQAVNRIREEVDAEANIIFGSTFDDSMEGKIRLSVVATGIDTTEEARAQRAAAQEAASEKESSGLFGNIRPRTTPKPVYGMSAPTVRKVPAFNTQPPAFAKAKPGEDLSAPTPKPESNHFAAPKAAEPDDADTASESASDVKSSYVPSFFERMAGGGRAKPVPPSKSENQSAAKSAEPEKKPDFEVAAAAPSAPVDNRDETLDIPAFLRRQVN